MENLTGKVFDRLTVTGFSHKNLGKHNRYYWHCICECGKEIIRRSDLLKTRSVSSCGCYRLEFSKKHFTDNNPKKTHGMTNTRLYKIYSKMKERCYSENYVEFHLYGGRGIKICDAWKSDFLSFYEWAINNGYSDDLSIDRIETNGDYEPGNCRWADKYEQANNKRNNIVLVHNGITKTLPEWARELNLPYSTLANRYRKGKTVEEILNPIKLR